MRALQHPCGAAIDTLSREVCGTLDLTEPHCHRHVCMTVTAVFLLADSRVLICREHLNIVFIGHVDAGKSTTGGQILYLTVRVNHDFIMPAEFWCCRIGRI